MVMLFMILNPCFQRYEYIHASSCIWYAKKVNNFPRHWLWFSLDENITTKKSGHIWLTKIKFYFRDDRFCNQAPLTKTSYANWIHTYVHMTNGRYIIVFILCSYNDDEVIYFYRQMHMEDKHLLYCNLSLI